MMSKSMSVEFEKPSMEEIYKLIEAELKGKPIQKTFERGGETIEIDPYYTEVKSKTQLFPTLDYRVNWKLYSIDTQNIVSTNEQIIEELNMGINGLILDFGQREITKSNLSDLFETIRLDAIHVLFKGLNETAFDIVNQYISQYSHEIPSNQIGFFGFSNPKYLEVYLIDDADFFKSAVNYIKRVKESNQLNHTLFILENSSDYLWDISKFRAFKTLMDNLKQKYYPKSMIQYAGHSKNLEMKQDETNLIRHTVSAMSSLIGMLDGVIIDPYQSNNPHAGRLSSNIANVIEHETMINSVNDIASGSYYIEHYSHQIAKKILNQVHGNKE